MRNTERRAAQDNGVLANGNDTNTHHNHGDNVSGRRRLINELRGFAEGSTSARASLMRDAADALDALTDERDRLGDAAFAAILTSGEDTDGARDWRNYFRPLVSPAWSTVVEEAVARERSDVDREADLIRAEAWDEGFDAGEQDYASHKTFDEPCIPNPYREASE